MLRNIPSFQSLAAFEAVARHHSFAKAADELSVTQSAVSHRIKSLERRFDTRFFERGHAGVTLTPRGAQFLEAVGESLNALEAVCKGMGGARAVVKLSVGPAFARNWLVERLGGFYRLHGDMDVEMNAARLPDSRKLQALRSGGADVAIRYGEPSDWPDFTCVQITHSEIYPVCSAPYRDAHGGLHSPRDLLSCTLLRGPRQPWRPWFAAASMEAAEPDHGPLFSEADLMLDAAAASQGVALARSTLVEQELAAGRLVKPFDIAIPASFAYQAICKPETAQRSEVALFLEWLLACAEGLADSGAGVAQ